MMATGTKQPSLPPVVAKNNPHAMMPWLLASLRLGALGCSRRAALLLFWAMLGGTDTDYVLYKDATKPMEDHVYTLYTLFLGG